MESNLSIGEMVARYFLMMGFVFIAGFSGYWIIGVLALPTFLSAISGFCPMKKMFSKA
jgi:hypothetical protein